jgi:hypothetical protein
MDTDTSAQRRAGDGSAGVIRAARKRARNDLTEALGETEVAQARELLGSDELDDGQMTLRRLEILPHGEDVDAGRARVVHRLLDFGVGLTEAEHQRRFGVANFAALLGVREDRERLLVGCAPIAHARL